MTVTGEMEVRKLSRRDAEEASQIIGEVMGWWHGYYAKAALETLERSAALLAVLNGKPVGTAVGYIAEGEGPVIGVVYYIAVREGYRRRGVGSLLLAGLERELKALGAEILLATIEEGNNASISLFKRRSFMVKSVEEFEEEIGWEPLEALLHAACSYEEELIAIKEVRGDVKLSCLKVGAYRETWWKACYLPWVRLRYSRRRGKWR